MCNMCLVLFTFHCILNFWGGGGGYLKTQFILKGNVQFGISNVYPWPCLCIYLFIFLYLLSFAGHRSAGRVPADFGQKKRYTLVTPLTQRWMFTLSYLPIANLVQPFDLNRIPMQAQENIYCEQLHTKRPPVNQQVQIQNLLAVWRPC